MKEWAPFTFLGDTYPLDHLTAFRWDFVQQATGKKPERCYRFLIEFGLHCFTRGLNKHRSEVASDIEPGLFYYDSREKRIFSFERYELSKKLPDIAKSISERPCFHTGKGNFFIIELVDDEGQVQNYEVYFNVARERKGLMRLFIESAYIRDQEHGTSQPKRKKINFFVIAHNTQLGKPIKSAPK